MTSRDAKTYIIDTVNGDMNKEYFINKLLPLILQDLDKLEELKKENKELKEEVEPYRLWNEVCQDVVESFRGVCQEDFNIQYIRNSEKYFGTEMAIVRGSTLKDIIIENAELEKVIDILLDKNGAVLIGSDNERKLHLINYEFVKYYISKEHYDLLEKIFKKREEIHNDK